MDTKSWIVLSLQTISAVGLAALCVVMWIWNPKTKRQWIIYCSILGTGIAAFLIAKLVTWAKTP
jgi:hypothetical protein